jgi:hypothetical protein
MAYVSSSDKSSRNAEKKLREIDRLKSKEYRNAEEEEKIEKEFFYRRVLDPSYKTEEEKEKERQKYDMLQKERESLKRRQCERHQKNQKKKLEREKELEKEREKERKWQEEREKERQKHGKWQQEENAKNREKRNEYPQTNNRDPLEKEYLSLLIQNKNDNCKTFRNMSRKYHPDKNLDNKKWAEEKQKQLQTIRDKYENINLEA